jgi:triosephosphate isomerase (TIM)
MRKKIIAGNWKMNKTLDEAAVLATEIRSHVMHSGHAHLVTILAPPFPYISELAHHCADTSGLELAAQNCHTETQGAFTGEVSAQMISSCGASFVLVGHSERRLYFQEDAEILRKKINQAYACGLTPIYCIGETWEQRSTGKHFETVAQQLRESLFHLTPDFFASHLLPILAYEPVWAIGTGNTATTEQAQEMHAFIRQELQQNWNTDLANACSILYGGSCNASNASDLFACQDIDGGLIGGASLKATDFQHIRQAMLEVLA